MSFSLGSLSKKIGSLFESDHSSLVPKSKVKYQSIRDGLESNYRIVIEGKVAPAAARFEICLLAFSALNEENLNYGDVALKLVIIPSGGYAILSSRTNKHWSEDERTQRGRLPYPLLQTNKFRMEIIVEPTQYRIEVNGVLFVTYLHRHSLENVRLLSYSGDFEVFEVFVQPPPTPAGIQAHLLPSSSSASSNQAFPSSDSDPVVASLNFPKLPLLLPIKGGLRVGTNLQLQAKIVGNRFDISFYQGTNPYDDPDGVVAFHMEVYLEEKIIVRNSFRSGKWQKEERGDLQFFPFFGHNLFTVQIFVEGNRFKIGVDGRHIFDYYHRITPISLIDHLGVHGQIQVQQLQLNNPPL